MEMCGGGGSLLRFWFSAAVELRRGLVEVPEEGRTEPTFHAVFGAIIPVPAVLLPEPLQFHVVAWEGAGRENKAKAVLGIGD